MHVYIFMEVLWILRCLYHPTDKFQVSKWSTLCFTILVLWFESVFSTLMLKTLHKFCQSLYIYMDQMRCGRSSCAGGTHVTRPNCSRRNLAGPAKGTGATCEWGEDGRAGESIEGLTVLFPLVCHHVYSVINLWELTTSMYRVFINGPDLYCISA